jgi:hypothetical protein
MRPSAPTVGATSKQEKKAVALLFAGIAPLKQLGKKNTLHAQVAPERDQDSKTTLAEGHRK